MTILMYLRKSRQDNENETIQEVLERHERQLQEYAIKAYGYKIDEKNIYREIVSGETIDDRPQINLLFERMQNENIEGVLVIETSRLTRGDLLDCGRVVHLFKYTNTLIITPQKTYDLDNKFDRKFFEMELTKGNDYLEYTKEILGRGRCASAHEGNYIGGTAPFGYDKIRIGKSPSLAINEKEAIAVRMIYDLYLNENIGYCEIANRINALGFRSKKGTLFIGKVINDILHNPIYIGKIKYKYRPLVKTYENGKLVTKRIRNENCELIDGKHEPIITKKQFQEVQEKKGRNCTMENTSKLTNVFSGILKCAKCGRSISRKSDKNKINDRYFCRNIHRCDTVSEQVEVVDHAVIRALQDTLNDFETKINDDNYTIANNHQKTIVTLEKELEKIENKQIQLYEFLENGIYTSDVFVIRNKALDEERQRTKKAIQNAIETTPNIKDYEEKVVYLRTAIEMLQNDQLDAKTKNNFLKKFIDVIYYEKNERGAKNKEKPPIKLTINLK